MTLDWCRLAVALFGVVIALLSILSSCRDALLIYDAEKRDVLDPLATIPGNRRFTATLIIFVVIAFAGAWATWTLWSNGQIGSVPFGAAAAVTVFIVGLWILLLCVSMSDRARRDLKANAFQRWFVCATNPQIRLALRLASAAWGAYAVLLLVLGYLWGVGGAGGVQGIATSRV